jgi:hypothetical protein
VAEDDRELGGRDFAVAEVEVCAADAASLDGEAELAGCGLGVGKLGLSQRLTRLLQDGSTHGR